MGKENLYLMCSIPLHGCIPNSKRAHLSRFAPDSNRKAWLNVMLTSLHSPSLQLTLVTSNAFFISLLPAGHIVYCSDCDQLKYGLMGTGELYLWATCFQMFQVI